MLAGRLREEQRLKRYSLPPSFGTTRLNAPRRGGHIALSHLARGPVETQVALATAIGHDKTRLIGVLDALEADGLITREPDPDDRRARLALITPPGEERHAAAVADTMEDELLAALMPGQRESLLAVLEILTVS